MPPVTTRTFFSDRKGVRQFLEVSWSGPEVETTTGKVGAAGRVHAKTFETGGERDAWIAQRIETALREGYVEGDPADVPVPEPREEPNPDAAEAERLRGRHGVPMFVPVFSAGDDGRGGSKLGGTPWLDGAWPVCAGCTQPLRFVLQLRREEVPASCRWAFRDDLLQLFLCDTEGKPGAPRWLCQADGQGWEPFAASSLVRQVTPGSPPTELAAALPEELRIEVARFEHAAQDAYRQMVGDRALPALTPSREAARAAQLLEVPPTDEAFHTRRSWIYPPRRITGWEEKLDVPAYGDLDLEQVRLLEEELDLRCSHVDKLAGAPAWAQNPIVVSCRTCRAPMRYLFQLRTSGPVHVGGDGIGWGFVCPRCHDGTFAWQR